MTNAIFKYELLNDEQLDQVAGGTKRQIFMDAAFFQQLGYDVAGCDKIEAAYSANGVQFTYDEGFDNYYKIKVNGEWCKHPHWAALGYILSETKYPGFNGKWTDAKYVSSFLKDNLGITKL